MQYNSLLADQVYPLSSAVEIPVDLSTVEEPNGDIYLRYSEGKEAEFGLIGVICGECLVAPLMFPK